MNRIARTSLVRARLLLLTIAGPLSTGRGGERLRQRSGTNSARSLSQHRRHACARLRKLRTRRILPSSEGARKERGELHAPSASKPSDSFPGLMALVAGEPPHGRGIHDVAYDRVCTAQKTTGNGVPAAPVSQESQRDNH